ncbi:MAG: hypothetical protein ACTSV7_15060 [Candidatus Baldrarchaeia archaeon]
MDEKSAELVAKESRKVIVNIIDALPDDASVLSIAIALETLSKTLYKTYPILQKYELKVKAIAENLSSVVSSLISFSEEEGGCDVKV